MNNSSSATHKSHTQHSTTLNRKYVKRPAAHNATSTASTSVSKLASARSAAAARAAANAMKTDTMKRRQALAEQMNRERLKNMKTTPRPKLVSTMAIPTKASQKPTPEPKVVETTKTDRAAESAMRAVATMNDESTSLKPNRIFTVKRVLLAFACSAIIVGALVYVVSQNISDIPVSVVAMQTGINTSYPSYIPRGYARSSVVTEEGKISFTFENSEKHSFTLTEEVSSWDSSTLERNDVKDAFTDYDVVMEGGLTLFISGSDCMWVNGGKKFYINTTSGSLTKKQLKSIAASL